MDVCCLFCLHSGLGLYESGEIFLFENCKSQEA